MKGIIYYTDNSLGDPIFSMVQAHLLAIGLPVTSSSLKPIGFGENEVINDERSYPTMVNQIISCLSRSKEKYVFFCEHDVLYHPSHFDFTPPRDDVFYYNENVWRWMHGSDAVIRHDRMIPLSAMCVNREFALDHYLLRQRTILENGFDKDKKGEPRWVRKMGYEPGTKKKKRGGITDDDFKTWSSDFPIIDIRHDSNFTRPKISLKDFKHKPKWWMELAVDKVCDWDLKTLFNL